MNYYQLLPNPASKKWKGYENPAFCLWDKDEELSIDYLWDSNKKWDYQALEYRNLKDGKIPPIHTIGATSIVFSASIPKIKSIEVPSLQFVKLINKNSQNQYYLMNVHREVDCVDWEKSEIDKWPDEHTLQEWHNPRGRFFINAVLIKSRIPAKLDIFKLQEWGGAFNIIISERIKEKIFELNFDKSFLVFKPLETI